MNMIVKLLIVALEVFLIDAIIAFFEAYRFARSRTLAMVKERAYRDRGGNGLAT